MSTKTKRGRKAWHYLVWWYPQPADGGKGQVCTRKATELQEIARKEGVGFDGSLPWKEGRTTKYYKGRILAKGVDPDKLMALGVHSSLGRLLEPGEKAFPPAVLESRLEKGREKRKENKVAKVSLMEGNISLLEEDDVGLSEDEPLPENSIGPDEPHTGASQGKPPHSLKNISEPMEWDSNRRIYFSSEAMVSSLYPLLENHCSWEICTFLTNVVQALKPQEKNNVETRAVVQFLEALSQESQKHASRKVEMSVLKPKFVQLDEHYFSKPKAGDNSKVRLFKGSEIDFYVHSDFLTEINLRMHPQKTWQRFVDLVLHKIYDKNLKFLSAEGKRNTQGIHSLLYKGFLRMAKSENGSITEREVTAHINALISNVKSCWRRKRKSSSAKPSQEITPDMTASKHPAQNGGDDTLLLETNTPLSCSDKDNFVSDEEVRHDNNHMAGKENTSEIYLDSENVSSCSGLRPFSPTSSKPNFEQQQITAPVYDGSTYFPVKSGSSTSTPTSAIGSSTNTNYSMLNLDLNQVTQSDSQFSESYAFLQGECGAASNKPPECMKETTYKTDSNCLGMPSSINLSGIQEIVSSGLGDFTLKDLLELKRIKSNRCGLGPQMNISPGYLQ